MQLQPLLNAIYKEPTLLSYKRGLVCIRKGKTLKWLTHARESPAGLSPPLQEVEGEIPSYTTNIMMFRRNLDCEKSLFFSLVDSQSQIARLPPLSQRKITTARSLDKIMCINKVIFCFQPGSCCFSYMFCLLPV